MGGAQPLAVTMNDGVAICVDCDETRIDRRIDHRYLDVKAARHRRRAAAGRSRPATPSGRCRSACSATPPRCFPNCCDRDAPIDIVTDQTSAHDPLSYLPIGIEFEDMKKMAEKDPVYFTEQAQASMAKHVEAMVGFMDKGAEVFDYGNSIRDEARKAGYDRAFDFPGFVPAYIRPQFEEGLGPVPLGGAVRRSRRTSRPPTGRSSSCSPTTSTCAAGSRWPRRRSPTRDCRPGSAGSATANGTRPG